MWQLFGPYNQHVTCLIVVIQHVSDRRNPARDLSDCRNPARDLSDRRNPARNLSPAGKKENTFVIVYLFKLLISVS